MKRDLSVMTPEVRKVLEKWLRWRSNHKKELCPFPGDVTTDCHVCYLLFPRKSTACPCLAFGLKYVTEVVRQALRDSL